MSLRWLSRELSYHSGLGLLWAMLSDGIARWSLAQLKLAMEGLLDYPVGENKREQAEVQKRRERKHRKSAWPKPVFCVILFVCPCLGMLLSAVNISTTFPLNLVLF